MERCPICRATLVEGTRICRRCQADLGSVIDVERQARALAGEAMLRLVMRDAAGARTLLGRARILRDAPDLRGFDALLRDQSAAALEAEVEDENAEDESTAEEYEEDEYKEEEEDTIIEQEPELEGEGAPLEAADLHPMPGDEAKDSEPTPPEPDPAGERLWSDQRP